MVHKDKLPPNHTQIGIFISENMNVILTNRNLHSPSYSLEWKHMVVVFHIIQTQYIMTYGKLYKYLPGQTFNSFFLLFLDYQ